MPVGVKGLTPHDAFKPGAVLGDLAYPEDAEDQALRVSHDEEALDPPVDSVVEV